VRLGAVRFGATGGYEVAPQPHRHEQIGHTAHMDVTDFAMVDTKLDAAEPIRPRFYAIPVLDNAGDTFAKVDGAHARYHGKT